ncbi:RAB34 [Bugula neritina]|uniref:RAB34 n=1 Tax=Bugula neritina TaxID=10212 RepID=A0A7J7JEZ6_BUGNE|nr:RAB34 [Bugula neritina]
MFIHTAVIVAFDLSDINTLVSARNWYKEAFSAAENPVVILVGMKKDMLSPAAYESTETDARRLAEEIGAEYWPTSSKTGENIREIVFRVVALTFNQMVKQEMEERGNLAAKSIGNNLKVKKSADLYEKRKKRICQI